MNTLMESPETGGTGQSAVLAQDMSMDGKVIEAVCDFFCLWKVSSKAYKRAIAKSNAWKAVSKSASTSLRILLGLSYKIT